MVLDQGNFLAEGTPREIAANKAVQTAYLGQAA
jgi:ABC-type branched-subunit amino acid transport system ATPase component